LLPLSPTAWLHPSKVCNDGSKVIFYEATDGDGQRKLVSGQSCIKFIAELLLESVNDDRGI
jgi:hypothetical protein